MRLRTAVVVLTIVASLGVPSAPVAARVDCTGAEYVESFDVTARPHRRLYRIGQTAVVDISVKDSLTGAPAADVDAGLFIRRDEKAIYGYGKTDAQGWTTVPIPLRPSSVRPGWIRVWVVAYEPITTPAYCTGRYGEREYKRFFRIRP